MNPLTDQPVRFLIEGSLSQEKQSVVSGKIIEIKYAHWR